MWREGGTATTVRKLSNKYQSSSERLAAGMKKLQNPLSRALSRGYLLLLFLAGSAWALDPHRLISQYSHAVWRAQDGLTKPRMITQTSDGYIWIAALGGQLLRFDGTKFTKWPSQKPFDGINWLLGSRDGSLWIATYSGLSRFKDGQLFNFPIKSGGVQTIVEDRAGAIWITRYQVNEGEGSLCRVAGKDLHCFDKSEGNPARFATSLAEDSSGNIWFGCRMLCRWTAGSTSFYMQEQMDRPSGDGVVALAAGADRSVWVGMDGVGPEVGVRYLSNGRFASYVVPGFDGATVRAQTLLIDRNQTLWIGTKSQGLYHVHDGRADHYSAAQGLSGDSVGSIYEDREGDLWVITDKAMDLFRDTPIVTFSSSEGMSGPDLASVIARKDSSVWVGAEGALNIIRPEGTSTITAAHGLPGQDVQAMLEDRSGQVWLGIDNTVAAYRKGRFFDVKTKDGRPLGQVGTIHSFVEDVDGNIWAIAWDRHSINHLLRIKDHQLQADIPITTLVPKARFLASDPEGGIWIGTSDGKLAHYRDGIANVVSTGSAHNNRVQMHAFFVDSAEVVWGATSKGLYRWDKGILRVMDSRNGLPCSAIIAAIKDDSGSMWLESICGYLKISAADLASWIAQPDSQLAVTTLDLLDGASEGWNSNNFQPNAAKSPDGRLWFSTGSFVQMIDPRHSYGNPTPPPVNVEGLVADGKSYASSYAVALPPLVRDLEIDYTALSFVLPQRIGFRYKLEGRDSGWQDPGLRRQAFYGDLRPGSYRFRVIASNNDGVWNETGATLDFKIAPAWYQTIWFRWLCAVASLVLLWAIYRARVRQIARAMTVRFDERLAERTRIAQDLHDTFLQTIQGSKLVADDALDPAAEAPRMRQALEKLSAWLGRATEEGRAALNSLRTSTTEVNDLAGAFRRAIEECRIHSSMEASLHVTGEVQEMHPIVRDEVYRIAYEAIRNACVHSHATQLKVELTYAKDLSLSVRDNGAGIDPDIVHRGKQGHFGLQSMRERAARIVGQLTIEGSANAGTEIRLVVPGGIIYSNAASKGRSFRGAVRSLLRKPGLTSGPQ